MSRAVALTTAVALLGFAGVSSASAATGVGVVELSDDGITYSSSYPGSIFDDITALSPGDSQSDTIYVRNAGTAAGYLRITIRDVSYSDQAFANALTVSTGATGGTGGAVAISAANPCAVTSEGIVLSPGQSIPVVATLALGNLNGTAGQGATASVSLRITLSDTSPGATPATSCDSVGTTVPVTPTAPGTSNSGGANGSSGVLPGGLAAPLPSPSPTMAPIAEEANGNGLLPALPATFSLDPNTWRLYQEYLVLILIFAAMVGAGISWLVGRRSRKEAEDV